MSTSLRIKSRVLPGGRIEVVAPELEVGRDVDVIIVSEESPKGQSLADFLRSLPPSRRTLKEWEEFDREFQEERDSWDR